MSIYNVKNDTGIFVDFHPFKQRSILIPNSLENRVSYHQLLESKTCNKILDSIGIRTQNRRMEVSRRRIHLTISPLPRRLMLNYIRGITIHIIA